LGSCELLKNVDLIGRVGALAYAQTLQALAMFQLLRNILLAGYPYAESAFLQLVQKCFL
jgi:hypothetical protein